MRLIDLLAVCTDTADLEVQVMIDGEGIIGSAVMLKEYLNGNALSARVEGIAAEDEDVLKVWVQSDENA